jgi:hypothetical protein
LVSYEIVALDLSLRVTECAVGDGDFYRSTLIDRSFEALVKRRMGQYYDRLPPEARRRIVKNFEEVKCAFDDRPKSDSMSLFLQSIL